MLLSEQNLLNYQMDALIQYTLETIAVLFLVLANGFFVAVEFAIVRSHTTKFREPQYAGKFGTRSALRLINALDLSLSATQLGITVASLVLGWYGESIFAHIFMTLFGHIEEPVRGWLSHGMATTLALLVVTFLHVVIGELAAKSLAIRYPETTLRVLAPVMMFFTEFCRPVIFTLNECANLFLKMFGLRAITESERVHTAGELSMLVAASMKYGVLDKEEEQMLQGVFHFSETVAREIMTPRTDVVAIPLGSTYEQVIEIIVRSGFSRFPVTGDSIDDVRGILLARDLLRTTQKMARGHGEKEKLDPCSLIREAYFIPGTKTINDLLTELKSRKVHMAIVLDEHGGFAGLVTLEDIIEEIVGDIFDESDGAKLDMIFHENGDVLIDGGVLVSEINEELEIKIPEGDYDTIAGFIFSALGRMANEGDLVTIDRSGNFSVNHGPFETIKGAHGRHETNLPFSDSHHNSEEEDDERLVHLYDFSVKQVEGNRIESVLYHSRTVPVDDLTKGLSKEETAAEVKNGSDSEDEEKY